MAVLRITYADGRTETQDYDGLILPPSYVKILAADQVTCIHESLIPRVDLHGATPGDFESLE